MERNIPSDASESIDFYLRTIYSVLRSRSITRISGFEEAHSRMESMLHQDARSDTPDFNAFIYSVLRLPSCILYTNKVIFGQLTDMFVEQGYTDIEQWQVVSAKARRRYCLFDGLDTLACFITSRSDIDDLIPELTAFQIEWNKFHYLLRDVSEEILMNVNPEQINEFKSFAEKILSPVEDLMRLYTIWGDDTSKWLLEMKSRTSEIRVRLLDSSSMQYFRTTNKWIRNILDDHTDIVNHPIYFVSSNTHSIANMLSGYALKKEKELTEFLKREDNVSLYQEWIQICRNELSASRENFLYYVLKKYQQTSEGAYSVVEQQQYEQERGIFRVASYSVFDLEAQIIDLSKIDFTDADSRVQLDGADFLKDTNAILFNIDYPLGMTAFNILTKVAEEFEDIRGIYIMGKAASLNGIYGDVIIPAIVHDMHSENTYFFQNAFSGADIEPWLVYGSILDNQRSISVFGTFLQNRKFVDSMYRYGFTDIEMEAGPYLSAVFEMLRPTRHPMNEIITLYNNKFDVGILHYVSDTPMSKGKNLGAGTLSYFGMDSTYACSTAILRRILSLEIEEKMTKNGL